MKGLKMGVTKLPSWSQTDGWHEGKIIKSDENAFMKNYKSNENAFISAILPSCQSPYNKHNIGHEGKIEVQLTFENGTFGLANRTQLCLVH